MYNLISKFFRTYALTNIIEYDRQKYLTMGAMHHDTRNQPSFDSALHVAHVYRVFVERTELAELLPSIGGDGHLA